MALTQVSTDGIKNSTISSADLGSNLKVTGSLFEVENTGGNANFEVTRVSGANFRIQSQASSVRLDTIGASHPILLGTNGNGRIRINDSTVDLINDNQRLRIGAGNDLQIYHDGSNSYIQNSTLSSLYINSASHIYLANADNSEFKAKFHNNSSVELYHDGSKKFETTSGGVDVTGSLSVANHITLPDQASGVGKLKLGDGVDFQLYHNGSHSVIENRTGNLIFYITSTGEVAAKFIPNGAVELYHDNSKKLETWSGGVIVTGNLNLNDNDKLALGDSGSDLQIYHNGTNSYVRNSQGQLLVGGSGGNLVLEALGDVRTMTWEGESMIEAKRNGAVELYYDNSKKLETKTNGITVTGSVLSLNDNNACIFFNTSSAGFGANIGIGRASTNNFHVTGSEVGDLVIAAEYEERIIFGLTTNTSGAPTIKMTMNPNGVIDGNFNDTSDANLKENINPIADNAITDIKQLKPVTFDWKDQGANNNVSGFIAQELKEVLPNLVNGKEWSEEDQSNRYTINTIGVVAHLTKALQEAITKIETLETKVAALEGA